VPKVISNEHYGLPYLVFVDFHHLADRLSIGFRYSAGKEGELRGNGSSSQYVVEIKETPQMSKRATEPTQ
jgi:hypothetical protein